MQSHEAMSVFTEDFRPRFHFTPKNNWMNDPNGLVYYKGKYHLFYQHNPQGILWGNMSWGHAQSVDLLHWEHLPVAIACTEDSGIFSGSAVIDEKNTSGFGSNENPPMVAIYTVHLNDGSNQSQHIAYSLDEGLSWIKYANNPVLDLGMKDFRDPKVSWDEESQRWLMTVAKPLEFTIAFFSSPDLKNWTHLSDKLGQNGYLDTYPSYLSAHKTFPSAGYKNPITKNIAQILAGSKAFGFDGSDLEPAIVNATEWAELTKWIAGKSTMKQAFAAIDASWSKA